MEEKTNREMENSVSVALGTSVEVELIAKSGSKERLAFVIVPDTQADFSQGFLSAETPLARAILGQHAGALIPYKMGDIERVCVVEVRTSENQPRPDTAEKREALVRKAVDKADLANAINFALTFDSKWGDYDPESMAANWDIETEAKKEPRDETKE